MFIIHLLNDLLHKSEHVGRLAVLEENDDGKVYVVWEVNQYNDTVLLVELDRPNAGETLKLNLEEKEVYLLNPLEVVERVTEWK